MADPAWLYPALGTGGGIVVAAGRELWAFFRRRTEGESTSKDLTIALLRADKERLEASVERLGAKLDKANEELLQAAGVTARIRQDPNVDDAFAEDMPTGVRNMADLVAPKTKSLPPEVKEALTTYNADMTITPVDGHKRGG